MTSLKQLKKEFLEYIEVEKGQSPKTVVSYNHHISRFLDFLKSDDPLSITDDSVREFHVWLNRRRSRGKSSGTLSKQTQNYHLIALRVFLKYLVRQEVKSLTPERIELAKVPERSLDLITYEELCRLLNSPNSKDLKDLRDKAILELLFSTGLRVSELCSLTRSIDLNSKELSIRGKGGKVRVVFLSEQAKKAIGEYLATRKDANKALFIPTGEITDRSLTSRSVERIIKQHATSVGISKKVTPHVIRHVFATDLLSNGADIRSVQAMLGHANIGTTQIYTHVTDRHLLNIHEKFHNKS